MNLREKRYAPSAAGSLFFAVQRVLTRIADDPDLAWYLGPGTAGFRDLVEAYAAATDFYAQEVEDAVLARIGQARLRRKPEVEQLMELVDELKEEVG